MSAQLYYTSCRRGLSPGSGFQVKAATPGIPPDDLEQVVRLGVHKSLSPSDLTPDAFRAVPLASGKLLLQYSRYLGRDYSGREGNFFTHSLLFSEEPPLWAVDYVDWPLWKKTLSEEEDSSPSAPLPEISPDPATLRASFRHQALSAFLQKAPQRKTALQRMLAGFFQPPEHRRKLIIRDEPENTPWWIACLTKCFPRCVANRLSFSTYQHDPTVDLDLAATVPGSGYDRAAPRIRETCRFYDFTTEEVFPAETEVFPEGETYANQVTEWLFSAPDRLSAFLDFMEAFGLKEITPALCVGLRLFEGVHAGKGRVQPASVRPLPDTDVLFSEQRLLEILHFFQLVEQTRLRRSSPTVLRALLRFHPALSSDASTACFRWWAASFNACLIRHAGLKSEPGALSQGPDTIDRWLELGEEVLKEPRETAASFSRAVRSNLDWKAAAAAMAALLPTQALRLLRLVHICFLNGTAGCSGEKLSPSWIRPPLLPLAKAFAGNVPSRHTALLGLLPAADRVHWLRAVAGECGGETLRLYGRQTPEEAGRLRAQLDACGAEAVLISEWRALLASAEDKHACFLRYLDDLAPGLPRTAPLLNAVCLMDLAESIPDSELRNRTALSGLLRLVPQAYEHLEPRCLEWANAGCAFVAQEPSLNAEESLSAAVRVLGQAAHSLGYKLKPDRPALHLLEKLLGRGRMPAGWLLASAAAALPFLSPQEYGEYLRRVMPALAAVPFACSVRCLRLLYRSGEASLFAQRLAAALKAPAGRPQPAGAALQDLWALPMAAFEFAVLEPPEAIEDAGADLETLYDLLGRLADLAPAFRILCEHKVRSHPDAGVQERWKRVAASVSSPQ